MDFIKKHYEKILLSTVLLGLVGALVFLPVLISRDKQEQEDMKNGIIHGKPTPLPELDLSRQDDILKRLDTSYELDFDTTNKLFNPLEWQKTVDGRIVKVDTGVGPQVAVVEKITPLYFSLSLDSVVTNALGTPPRYMIYVERQASPNPAFRRRTQRFVSTDDPRKDLFTLLQVVGTPENPSELVFKLADTGETAVVSKDKPFQRVDAYMADLKYDPEKLSRTAQRVGADLKFADDDYNIIAINQNEVVLLQQSNQKKWTLRYEP
jgi:hypothetical protein